MSPAGNDWPMRIDVPEAGTPQRRSYAPLILGLSASLLILGLCLGFVEARYVIPKFALPLLLHAFEGSDTLNSSRFVVIFTAYLPFAAVLMGLMGLLSRRGFAWPRAELVLTALSVVELVLTVLVALASGSFSSMLLFVGIMLVLTGLEVAVMLLLRRERKERAAGTAAGTVRAKGRELAAVLERDGCTVPREDHFYEKIHTYHVWNVPFYHLVARVQERLPKAMGTRVLTEGGKSLYLRGDTWSGALELMGAREGRMTYALRLPDYKARLNPADDHVTVTEMNAAVTAIELALLDLCPTAMVSEHFATSKERDINLSLNNKADSYTWFLSYGSMRRKLIDAGVSVGESLVEQTLSYGRNALAGKGVTIFELRTRFDGAMPLAYRASCPACGAPIDPGQRFCNQCGVRFA